MCVPFGSDVWAFEFRAGVLVCSFRTGVLGSDWCLTYGVIYYILYIIHILLYIIIHILLYLILYYTLLPLLSDLSSYSPLLFHLLFYSSNHSPPNLSSSPLSNLPSTSFKVYVSAFGYPYLYSSSIQSFQTAIYEY